MSGDILSPRDRLQELETVISVGLQHYYQAALALQAVQVEQLYKLDYETFEEYCLGRWQIKRSRAYQLIDYAKTRADLSTTVDNVKELPTSERQTRALAGLPPTEKAAVWREAQRTTGSPQPSGRDVSNVRSYPKAAQLRKSAPKTSGYSESDNQRSSNDFDQSNPYDDISRPAAGLAAHIAALEAAGYTVIPPDYDGPTCPYCGRRHH